MTKFYETKGGWSVEMTLACAESFQKPSEAFIKRALKKDGIAKDLPEGGLEEAHEQNFGNLVVCATNLSFALELYLKSLLALLGLQVPNTHDLLKLYNNLPSEIKSEIEERYERGRTTPSPVHASITVAKAIRPETPKWSDNTVESKALANVLERSKDMFKTWRYIFEGQPKEEGFHSYKFEYLLLLFACVAVRATIKDQMEQTKHDGL